MCNRARSLLSLLAVGAVALTALPTFDAHAAAPPLEVGRMKRIILPPEGPVNTANTTGNTVRVQPSPPPSSQPPPSQPRALANPVPNSVPVQSMIQRGVRVQGAGQTIGPLP